MGFLLYRGYKSLKKKWENWKRKEQNRFLNSKIKTPYPIKFAKNINITAIEKIQFGKNIFIGDNAFIRADGGLIVGDNVVISRNVVIYTKSHNYKGKYLPYDDKFIHNPVKIEDNVWIGMNVTIAPGTIIGEGSIIAIGARIFGKIEPLSIIGSDGKLIKYRDKAHYEKLKQEKKFANADGEPI